MANVNVTFNALPLVISLTGSEVFALDQAGTTKQATIRQAFFGAATGTFPAAIEYVVDSGGANMSTGVKGYLEVPFSGTVALCDLYADQTGSVSVDIWRCSYSQFDAGITHPVAADSICNGFFPTFTLATKATQNGFAGVVLNTGDVLGFYISSVSSILRLTISIKLTRNFT